KELIRDLLERRIEELGQSDDTELLRLLNQAMERGEGEERQGIFVKNIENVQGDERDVIIFSVGYARNEKGKLVTHFGLLNQKGGENRLNVAVTRAKKKIYVLCSFDPAELKVAETKHPGPKMFKRYLQFAQAISNDRTEYANELLHSMHALEEDAPASVAAGATDLQRLLKTALENAGLRVRAGIGDTNYKLDLAVLDDAGEFVLGIECEGNQYFSGKSAKEREVYRLNLLEKRGWKVVRVWTRNYFLDPEGTVQRLIDQAKPAWKSSD
ncbi:MAG: AAA domain-containing protein, partial [Bacteroidota bacterium]